MRPDAQPCAERAAHERRQYADAAGIDTERGRQRVAHILRPLGRVMDRQRIAVPDRHGGKQADWIVRVLGRGVGHIDLHVGCRKGAGHVPAHVIGRPWMGHPRGSGVVVGEDRRVRLVRDLDQRGRRLRLLPRLSDDHRHVLAVVQNDIALEWWQRRWTTERGDRPPRQRWRIDVRDDGQHPRRSLGGVHRDVTDSSARHCALHQNSVGQAGKGDVDRVRGGTHHLEAPVDAISRGTDYFNNGRCTHSFASLAEANARTMVRFASSILKWLCSRATGSGQRDLGCVAKRVVTRLAAGQAPLGLDRAPWLGRDPAQCPASLLGWCRHRDRGRRPLTPARTRSSPGPSP